MLLAEELPQVIASCIKRLPTETGLEHDFASQ